MYDVYNRKVNDLLSFLGDIGGLAEGLLGIGVLIVGFISQKMFMSKIVRKIYHIRKYDNINHEAVKRANSTINGPEFDESSKDMTKMDEETLM